MTYGCPMVVARLAPVAVALADITTTVAEDVDDLPDLIDEWEEIGRASCRERVSSPV